VLPERHNSDTGWQGRFRVGAFDAVTARYALRACGGVDGLAITHLDRLPVLPPRVCAEYSVDGRCVQIADLPSELRTELLAKCQPVYSNFPNERGAFVDRIQQSLGTEVVIESTGPTYPEKKLRRGF
jgi:adenylosuccinate synthase